MGEPAEFLSVPSTQLEVSQAPQARREIRKSERFLHQTGMAAQASNVFAQSLFNRKQL